MILRLDALSPCEMSWFGAGLCIPLLVEVSVEVVIRYRLKVLVENRYVVSEAF